MNVVVNGNPRQVAENATVEEVLAGLGMPEQGVAVAVDGEVVPRARWAATALRPDAAVEVLTAVQGG